MSDPNPQQTGATATSATAPATINTPAAATPAKDGVNLGDLKTGGTPQDDKAKKFKIPDEVKQKYPDLVTLILNTESMNDDEKQYWFQILPIMTDDQVKKLYDILQNEKNQLAELDAKYKNQMQTLDNKHQLEQMTKERQEERTKLKTDEQTDKEKEKTLEEDLLKQLDS